MAVSITFLSKVVECETPNCSAPAKHEVMDLERKHYKYLCEACFDKFCQNNVVSQ